MPELAPFLVDPISPELAELIRAAPVPTLGAGPQDKGLLKWLAEVDSGCKSLSIEAKSALYLLAGDLDASHTISQSLDTPDGSLLHAIMHRREGDFSNAKYWLRRAADHAALRHLKTTSYGDAIAFVDRCAATLGTGSEQERELERLQWIEWQTIYGQFASEPGSWG